MPAVFASQSWHAPRIPAKGTKVGIGGWCILYPAAPSHGSQKPGSSKKSSKPFLTKEAQRYIACFTAEGQAVRGLRMPSGTDNTASEAGVNKLFTTAWPLQISVQVVAKPISTNGQC